MQSKYFMKLMMKVGIDIDFQMFHESTWICRYCFLYLLIERLDQQKSAENCENEYWKHHMIEFRTINKYILTLWSTYIMWHHELDEHWIN